VCPEAQVGDLGLGEGVERVWTCRVDRLVGAVVPPGVAAGQFGGRPGRPPRPAGPYHV